MWSWAAFWKGSGIAKAGQGWAAEQAPVPRTITRAETLPRPLPSARDAFCITEPLEIGKVYNLEAEHCPLSVYSFKHLSRSQAQSSSSPFDPLIVWFLSATGIRMIPSHSLVARTHFREKRSTTTRGFRTRKVLNTNFPPLGETP